MIHEHIKDQINPKSKKKLLLDNTITLLYNSLESLGTKFVKPTDFITYFNTESNKKDIKFKPTTIKILKSF